MKFVSSCYNKAKGFTGRQLRRTAVVIDNATGTVVGSVGGGLMVAGANAHATAPATVSDLTTGIDFSEVTLGILAVAALLIAVYVTWKASKMIIHAVKGL